MLYKIVHTIRYVYLTKKNNNKLRSDEYVLTKLNAYLYVYSIAFYVVRFKFLKRDFGVPRAALAV